jgi:site-specific DNA-methyltransferase (adenine-specific)
MWIYSSGFPKSQDVGRSIQRSLGVKETKKQKGYNGFGSENGTAFTQDWDRGPEKNPEVVCTDPEAQQWEGWGTSLKPAHEPIALARKPLKLSIAKNCQAHGVGALNIDATRVGDDPMIVRHLKKDDGKAFTHHGDGKKNWDSYEDVGTIQGRFPSNVIGDIPDYQKYFYCPKVSRAERHVGHETPPPMFGNVQGAYGPDGNRMAVGLDARNDQNKGNNHPTVKPIELMKYLIKLITPPGGTVLDPFNGSGSTGCAAVELGMTYIGCELDANYVAIAERRIEAWYAHANPTTYNELFGT